MGYLPKDKKRQAILEATLSLAASIGFAGITARKLAQAMGAATGTIHHHFSSLDDLKQTAFQYQFEITLANDREAVNGLPTYEALQKLLLPSHFFDRQFEGRVWSSAEDEMWRNEKLRQIYSEAILTFVNQLETLIQKGVAEAVFQPLMPARQCAWKLHASSWSLSNLTYLGDEILDLATADAIVFNDIQTSLGVRYLST